MKIATTLFGTASAWFPTKNAEGKNALMTLEVGSIYPSKDMNIQWNYYTKGTLLTSKVQDENGAEWEVMFKANCIGCFGKEGSNSVYIGGANELLSIAAIEEMDSTYSNNGSSTQPYMSPYDLVRFISTTCLSIDGAKRALQDLIIWNDLCSATKQPLGLKFLIAAQDGTAVLTFNEGVPHWNEETTGMIGTEVQQNQIAQLAGGYDIGVLVPTGKMINGHLVRSLGPGSNGRLIGGFSTLSKLTRLTSLFKFYQKLSPDSWVDNIGKVWPAFSSVIAPKGSSSISVETDLTDVSTRINIFITGGFLISPTLENVQTMKGLLQHPKIEGLTKRGKWTLTKETKDKRHLKQITQAPFISPQLKASIPIEYYFQGISIMKCPFEDLIGAGNFNGLSLSDTEDPLGFDYLDSGTNWTSISSSGQKGFSWEQRITFYYIYPPEKVKNRNIPVILFAQNPTLMIRLLNYSPSTYSPQGFIEGKSVGAIDLACLIAGTCYSIKEVKDLLEGIQSGELNIVDQELEAYGGSPALQYHIATRPDTKQDPYETPVVLYFKDGIPQFSQNPRNIAVSDYSIERCEQSLAELASINPDCLAGPIGSGTNLLPQDVNSTDVFAKAAKYLTWDPDLDMQTLYALTGSIEWDNRVTIEVDQTLIDLTTLSNYWVSYNDGSMLWKTPPTFEFEPSGFNPLSKDKH